MAIAALAVAIVMPLLSIIVSIIVAVKLHHRALQRADEANAIARRSLDIEESRLTEEQRAWVAPVRYDGGLGGPVFEVLASSPLYQVIYEFRLYNGEGGACTRDHESPGIKNLRRSDFLEDSSLETPGLKQFLARARWRRTEADEWQESGVYICDKANRNFLRRQEQSGQSAGPTVRNDQSVGP